MSKDAVIVLVMEQMDELRDALSRLEGKVDALFALRSRADQPDKGRAKALLGGMTLRQHAVGQMMLLGVVDREMGERMGVTRNTIKLHRAAIANKVGAQTSAEAVRRLGQLFDAVDAVEYQALSGGLPKNWAATYSAPDPYAPLYRRE